MTKRPPTLFVYMDPPERAAVAKLAAEATGYAKRAISVSEYVRAALKFTAEHKAQLFERLRAP